MTVTSSGVNSALAIGLAEGLAAPSKRRPHLFCGWTARDVSRQMLSSARKSRMCIYRMRTATVGRERRVDWPASVLSRTRELARFA